MAGIAKPNLPKKTTLPDLPNSNSLSRCRARRPQVIVVAPLLCYGAGGKRWIMVDVMVDAESRELT